MKLKQVAPNVTEIHTSEYTVLFSYETPVACLVHGKGFKRTAKVWSPTTSRHINKWLGDASWSSEPQEFFDALL